MISHGLDLYPVNFLSIPPHLQEKSAIDFSPSFNYAIRKKGAHDEQVSPFLPSPHCHRIAALGSRVR
jgi:hypothetical protein